MEKTYKKLKKSIPNTYKLAKNSSLSEIVMPFGLNLLLELTFIFLVSVKADVVPDDLKLLIIGEFSNILHSIV